MSSSLKGGSLAHLRPVPRKAIIKRTLFGVLFIIGLLAGFLLFIFLFINNWLVALIWAAIEIVGLLLGAFFIVRRSK
jgi:hypothetical protein